MYAAVCYCVCTGMIHICPGLTSELVAERCACGAIIPYRARTPGGGNGYLYSSARASETVGT